MDYNLTVYDRIEIIQVLNIQSYVDNDVVSIKVLYRLVYWTTQLLTWLLIPFLSAYVQGKCSNNSYFKVFTVIFRHTHMKVSIRFSFFAESLRPIGPKRDEL